MREVFIRGIRNEKGALSVKSSYSYQAVLILKDNSYVGRRRLNARADSLQPSRTVAGSQEYVQHRTLMLYRKGSQKSLRCPYGMRGSLSPREVRLRSNSSLLSHHRATPAPAWPVPLHSHFSRCLEQE